MKDQGASRRSFPKATVPTPSVAARHLPLTGGVGPRRFFGFFLIAQKETRRRSGEISPESITEHHSGPMRHRPLRTKRDPPAGGISPKTKQRLRHSGGKFFPNRGFTALWPARAAPALPPPSAAERAGERGCGRSAASAWAPGGRRAACRLRRPAAPAGLSLIHISRAK